MAIGPFTFFDRAVPKVGNGVFDLDTHTFKAILCNNSQALAANFAGTSTDARLSDITGEFTTGGGYTAGGETLASVTWTRAGAVATFDAADLTWAALTLASVTYLVIYDDSAANDDLLGFIELNVGGSISPAGVDLTIAWDAQGIFTQAAV